MTKVDYLILGGGIAGTSAAETIRSHQPDSTITILTEEPNRLYSRVLLPHYLRNENSFESLFVRSEDNYQKNKIELKTNCRVNKIDTQKQEVFTDKETYVYSKLLIATGGKVNKLSIQGGQLEGVVYLRTLEDVKKIKELIETSKEAVVLGGGFIGIEFAQSFIKNGLKTTAVIREKAFWEPVVGENSGKLLSQLLVDNGVTVLPESEISEFVGEGKLRSVKLGSGQEIIAQVAGVGIGIHLELDYLKDSGLTIKKGVVTNEFLEASLPNVWAAGDIAEFYDPIFHRYHTLGNWSNASAQGRTVGLNMAGIRTAFETTSMYSINIFGINFSFLGDPGLDSETEIIERGSLTANKLGRLLIKNERIVGASLINMPLERNVITKLIKEQVKIITNKTKLSDPNFNLNSLVS